MALFLANCPICYGSYNWFDTIPMDHKFSRISIATSLGSWKALGDELSEPWNEERTYLVVDELDALRKFLQNSQALAFKERRQVKRRTNTSATYVLDCPHFSFTVPCHFPE